MVGSQFWRRIGIGSARQGVSSSEAVVFDAASRVVIEGRQGRTRVVCKPAPAGYLLYALVSAWNQMLHS